ncbi:MAG: hypothetical protein RR597_04520 [Christensenella sp.]
MSGDVKKEPWTNVIRYEAKDYLPKEEFAKLRNDLRVAWRALGWLHLRMTNDIDIASRSPLSRPELRRRLTEVEKEIEKLMDVYLKE